MQAQETGVSAAWLWPCICCRSIGATTKSEVARGIKWDLGGCFIQGKRTAKATAPKYGCSVFELHYKCKRSENCSPAVAVPVLSPNSSTTMAVVVTSAVALWQRVFANVNARKKKRMMEGSVDRKPLIACEPFIIPLHAG